MNSIIDPLGDRLRNITRLNKTTEEEHPVIVQEKAKVLQAFEVCKQTLLCCIDADARHGSYQCVISGGRGPLDVQRFVWSVESYIQTAKCRPYWIEHLLGPTITMIFSKNPPGPSHILITWAP